MVVFWSFFVLIKDFNAFMYNQSKHKEKKHFCMYCLQCFSSERILANHVNNCLTINDAQAINMPKQGENILKFNNFHKQLPVPFVIYADFEAITKKVQGCEQSEEMKNEKNKRSYTEAYQTHEDCGYGYKGSVIFYQEGGGAPENWGDQVLCLRSKGGIKRFFKLKRGITYIF